MNGALTRFFHGSLALIPLALVLGCGPSSSSESDNRPVIVMKVPVEKLGPQNGVNYEKWSAAVASDLKGYGSNCLTDEDFYIQLYDKASASNLSKNLGVGDDYLIENYTPSDISKVCSDGGANARGKIISIKLNHPVKNIQNEVNKISSAYFIPLLVENSIVSDDGSSVVEYQVTNPVKYRYNAQNLKLFMREIESVYGSDCCAVSDVIE